MILLKFRKRRTRLRWLKENTGWNTGWIITFMLNQGIYGLNCIPFPNLYVKAPTSDATVFGDGAFRR